MTPRDRLANARLYLVCPARPRAWLEAAVAGGVDILQLRDKSLDDDGLIAAAAEFRDTGALFILNDRPDLVEACGADGVHLGQDDPGTKAGRILGRSTHAPAQAEAALADPEVDYLSIGPVHETPTGSFEPRMVTVVYVLVRVER